MEKHLLKSYKSYAKNVKLISIMSGIWPSTESSVFYRWLPYLISFVLFMISFTTMNFAYVNIHNLNHVMKGMSISLSYLNAIMKVICYLVHREEIIELNDTINELLRRQQADEKLLSRALSPFKFFKVLSVLLMSSAFIVVGMYFITPLIIMINQYSHGVKPIRYLLPYPALYPYDIRGGSVLYVLHYVMESYGCFCLFSITASIDNLFALYSSQIIGHLRALTYEMRRFTFKAGYEKHLQKLVKIHQRIIRCCKLLQAIHGPIVLSMMLTTAIILCCLIFQISQMKTISMRQIIFIFLYISVKLLQTLIYAWAGTLITTECDNFRNEVYGTGWENLGKKSTRYHVGIILMQRPIRLKACSYTFISVNLFTGILNTTLSYFFLLQALDDKIIIGINCLMTTLDNRELHFHLFTEYDDYLSVLMDISASERAEVVKHELKEFHRFRRNIKYWAFFSGSWPIKDPNLFYRCLPFIVFISTSLISIQQFRFVLAHITNIGMMVGGFSLGTSFLSVAMKVVLFKFHRERILEIQSILDSFQKESLSDENLKYFFLGKLPGFRRLVKILSICVLFGCVFCIIGPALFFIAQIRRNIRPLKYTLPTPAAYPWNTHDLGLLYILTFLYESYNVVAIGVVTLGIDGLFAFYVFLIIGQLRILGEEMASLTVTSHYKVIVREWVTKFLVLKRCCGMLQKIYGPIILWQVVTNSTVICAVLFQITHVSGISIGRYLLIFGYSGTKIMQTYLYSWAGSSLTAESEALRNSVYFSKWTEKKFQRFRTSVLIILTQKPLVIVAAACVYISLDMFLMTLNTAVSYFFLLQTFEEKAS
ncbi:uncharacterized protein LOC135161818 [Diachasmimorpha longicaudata]|uniref:uncharacterized protein LOC135161818 n=1 Tax=Diachasmimorpha longicaudata TaxID=58733 RepID=UPI0030B8C3A0